MQRVFGDDFGEPEPVIAGFIRFTEFLAAMDGIFPNVDTRSIPDLQMRSLRASSTGTSSLPISANTDGGFRSANWKDSMR